MKPLKKENTRDKLTFCKHGEGGRLAGRKKVNDRAVTN
jgi:hypothetical protein